MSANEQQPPIIEQRSSVKVTRNAKGDPQFEIKVVDGVDEAEMMRLQRIAVAHYWDLVTELSRQRPKPTAVP